MEVEVLVEYTAALNRPKRKTGAGRVGTRGLAVGSGGSFEGPRLKGTIWAGGGDWWLRGPDGVTRLDVRATFETGDGALIYVQYYGVNRPDARPPIPPPGEPSGAGGACSGVGGGYRRGGWSRWGPR